MVEWVKKFVLNQWCRPFPLNVIYAFSNNRAFRWLVTFYIWRDWMFRMESPEGFVYLSLPSVSGDLLSFLQWPFFYPFLNLGNSSRLKFMAISSEWIFLFSSFCQVNNWRRRFYFLDLFSREINIISEAVFSCILTIYRQGNKRLPVYLISSVRRADNT